MSPDLAERVAEVPALYEKGSRSTACLLKDIGLTELDQELPVDQFAGILRQRPRLAELWLKRGRDQRVAGGWGIEREDGAWRVRNFADGQTVSSPDRFRACAEFLVRYVAFIIAALRRWR